MTKLEEMLKYVSEHNEFYKKRIKEYGIKDPLDITQWPILTRKELQENRYNMFSDGYKSKYFNQQLRRQSSSGSSGVPVNVYWDYNDWYASNMALWRKRQRWYGINPSERCVMFTLNAINYNTDGENVVNFKVSGNTLNINVSCIRDDCEYKLLIDKIEDFRPKWMYLQPYILKKLINIYKLLDKCIPVSVKYVECVGEVLDNKLRGDVQAIWGVPIINMYGSEEMNAIGYECKNQNMHILTDNVFVEIKNGAKITSSGEGEAIITNLNNKSMPLIRYNQEDIIHIGVSDGVCFCNSTTPIIEKIKGRVYEIVRVNDCFEINPLMLLETIADVINEYGNIITSYRFVFHKSTNELQCLISLEENYLKWYHNISNSIEREIYQKLLFSQDIHFSVVLSNSDSCFVGKNKILTIQ